MRYGWDKAGKRGVTYGYEYVFVLSEWGTAEALTRTRRNGEFVLTQRNHLVLRIA